MAKADNTPRVVVAPPSRCGELVSVAPRRVCGAIAVAVHTNIERGDDQFVCVQHALSSDVGLPAERVFRRVYVTLDVFLAGTSIDRAAAQAEAVALLERAIAAIGGIPDVRAVTSAIVRSGPPAAAGVGQGAGIDPV